MGLIFLAGTFWFWLLLITASILIIATTEIEESNSWGIAVLLVTLGLLYFCNVEAFRNAAVYLTTHPVTIILSILGYLILGTAWSFVKWYLYLTNIKLDLKTRMEESGWRWEEYRFSALYNKERIINYMIYWPLSGLWTLVDEPIRKSFKRIFAALETTYQKISDKITADIRPIEQKVEKAIEKKR